MLLAAVHALGLEHPLGKAVDMLRGSNAKAFPEVRSEADAEGLKRKDIPRGVSNWLLKGSKTKMYAEM